MALPDNRFSQAYEAFVQMERKHDLLQFQPEGVPLWRLVRGQVYYELLEERGIVERGESVRLRLGSRLWMRGKRIAREIFTLTFWTGATRAVRGTLVNGFNKAMMLPSVFFSRRILLGDHGYDALVSCFPRKIAGTYRITGPVESFYGSRAILLDKPDGLKRLSSRLEARIFNRHASRKPSSTDALSLDGFAEKVADLYHLPVSRIRATLETQAVAFLRFEKAFIELLEKHRIKTVYLCWNRYYFALISAARKIGIPVVELQHGIIGPYHVQYAWEGFEHVPCFPDRFLTFGPAWQEDCPFPQDVETATLGSIHMDGSLRAHLGRHKEKDLVVVFSQKIIGLELFRFVLETARLRPDLRFHIKLHPAERYQDLTSYSDHRMPGNVTIAGKHEDSYALMARAQYQLGVSSTTLVEGLRFSNRVVVVPLPSWEYMEGQIRSGDMCRADTPEKAAELLNVSPQITAGGERYYSASRQYDPQTMFSDQRDKAIS